MGWIRCIRCEKFWRDFVARTFRNKSTRSTPLDPKLMFWCVCNIGCVRCEKFRCDFVARTFTLVRPVLHQFCKATKRSRVRPNGTKYTKTSVYGLMGWIACVRCEKFWCDFVARTFTLIAPVQPILYRALCSNETIQNTSKHEFRANWVDWVHSLRKILMRLRGTNFYINCTSSTRFAPSFVL